MTIAFDATSPPGLGTKLAAGLGGLVLLVGVIAAGAGAGIASLLGGGESLPSATATAEIPPAMLALYQEAATTCPGLPWTVLAAIGTVESDNNQSTLPGVHSGLNEAGVAADIWMWSRDLRHVGDDGRGARACEVSAWCEARELADWCHSPSIGSGADGWPVPGVACGVAE